MKTQNKGGRKAGDKGAKNGASGRRRANNAGTLEKRGNKWRARWTSYTPEGVPVRMTKTLDATNVADARKELDALTGAAGLMSEAHDLERVQTRLGGIRAEIQRIEDAKPALALADMFAAYKDSPRRKKKSGRSTMHQYELQIGKFVSWMSAHYPEAKEMRQVSEGIAEDFLKHIGKSHSPNTLNKYRVLLSAVWRTLGKTARCSGNPWDSFEYVQQSEDNGRRPLTMEELVRVCSSLTGEMRVLFALGLYTGLRLGDCCLMDWGSVDMVRRLIVTTPRKTKKRKTVVDIPIRPELYAVLDETPSARRTGYLVPDMAATYERDTSAVAARIRRVFEQAGFKTRAEVDGYKNRVAKIGFHSLRHTFVSLLGNSGASLALVQSLVGHANPMMTEHYFHAQTAALANAVGRLPSISFGTAEANATDAEAAQRPADAVVDVEAVVTADGTPKRLDALADALDAVAGVLADIRANGDADEIAEAERRVAEAAERLRRR